MALYQRPNYCGAGGAGGAVAHTVAGSYSVADPEGAKGAMPPWPVRNSHKKMVAEHSGLYFMFLAPPI